MQLFSAEPTIFLIFFCPRKLVKLLIIGPNLSFSVMPAGPNPAQISFLFHKILPPRVFSIMTLVSRTVQIPLRSKTGDITYGWPLAAVHSNAHDWWHEKHSLMETLVHLRKMNRTLCILLTVLWLKPWESRLSNSTRRGVWQPLDSTAARRRRCGGGAIYISFLAHGPSI